MLFTGHAEVIIDAKQRLGIPAKYRGLSDLKSGEKQEDEKPEAKSDEKADEKRDVKRGPKAWYSLPWTGGVIRLYTEPQFELLAAAFAKRMDESITTDGDEAELESILFGMVERIEPDATGRVVIPWKHLLFTKVCGESADGKALTNGEVVVIGARNRLEVRNLAQWKQEEHERFTKLPALIARTEKGRKAEQK